MTVEVTGAGRSQQVPQLMDILYSIIILLSASPVANQMSGQAVN
jgi:hypothetical protein